MRRLLKREMRKKRATKRGGFKTLGRLTRRRTSRSRATKAAVTPAAPPMPAPTNGNGSARRQILPLPDEEMQKVEQALGSIKSRSGIDLTEAVKSLVRLAHEQGYLTVDNVHEGLPENLAGAEDVAEVYQKLGALDIEIIDQSDADRLKRLESDEMDENAKLDALDDPLRMYFSQMGKVPLLTREQEVEICRRIAEAENDARQILYSFGFAAKEHVALAEKLVAEPPKERFDRVIIDSKLSVRPSHLKGLRKLIKAVRKLDRQADLVYAAWRSARDE